MNKIYLSDSGPKVSQAIYGFWRWTEEGDLSLKSMEKITNLCLELGINTFDHADRYGNYQCEELFGQVVKQNSFKREEIVLFTKCGLNLVDKARPETRVNHYNTSGDHILKSVDNSLKKLNTDYIDIFLLEYLDPTADLEETAGVLLGLKEKGKIKHIGVANFSAFQQQSLAAYLRAPIVTNHIELNVLNTNAVDNGQLDFIKQNFSKALAWAPLAGGEINNPKDEKSIRVKNKLEEIGKKYNANIEQTAVAWLVKLGALPLLGTLDKQHIKNVANAFDINLDRQDWYAIYTASKGEII